MDDATIALHDLSEQVAACPKCALSKTRTKAVPGAGDPHADIVFIGEGPGYNEDQQGLPFVGQAGKFLDELLASIDLRREDVYIANVIKCRPPNNRDPQPGEIEACAPWLDQQLDIIKPRMIVTLGRFSMSRYFQGQTIGRIHGQPKKIDGVVVVPMYHPAAALHQANLRGTIMEDFKKLPGILRELSQSAEEPAKPEPVQMKLL
ncbi:MAG: uracil-DNA glycosylase [Chloroflexi bacterium]|nr:uracil-DNA glycosylase [Chloroflexota bacterium]MCH8008693.1 uracil-DNA glycosylase [Chloroflexota bacterium]